MHEQILTAETCLSNRRRLGRNLVIFEKLSSWLFFTPAYDVPSSERCDGLDGSSAAGSGGDFAVRAVRAGSDAVFTAVCSFDP